MDTTPERVDVQGKRAIWEVSPAGHYTYVASWIARFFANLLDTALMIGTVIGLAAMASATDTDATLVLAVVGSLAAYLLYQPLMLAFNGGQTLGKLALGIRVVNADRSPIGLGRAFAREVGLKVLPSVLSPLNLIDYIWAAFRDDRRSLHDLAAGTFVVERRGRG